MLRKKDNFKLMFVQLFYENNFLATRPGYSVKGLTAFTYPKQIKGPYKNEFKIDLHKAVVNNLHLCPNKY